jgi:SpoVK/Ycf46/Vps4 family AAA+-type ATPase
MSKWYGESENLLASILETIGKIAEQRGGAVIMIDEIDEIGGNREKSHEASGKITGVLLKKLDGIERINNILLVGATNRKESLDPALLDRFKHSQFFRLPDAEEVSAIVRYYIPELIDIPENVLASITGKISGRSIKKICEDVARRCIKNEEQGIEMSI